MEEEFHPVVKFALGRWCVARPTAAQAGDSSPGRLLCLQVAPEALVGDLEGVAHDNGIGTGPI
jgi:hypothetical protein